MVRVIPMAHRACIPAFPCLLPFPPEAAARPLGRLLLTATLDFPKQQVRKAIPTHPIPQLITYNHTLPGLPSSLALLLPPSLLCLRVQELSLRFLRLYLVQCVTQVRFQRGLHLLQIRREVLLLQRDLDRSFDASLPGQLLFRRQMVDGFRHCLILQEQILIA